MAEAIVEHDYTAKQPDELTIKKGDVIKEVIRKLEGWCEGVLDGRRGLFPDNFVVVVPVKMRANAATLRRCRVLYSYKQEHEDELSLMIGDVIEIVGEEEEGWWKGRMNGKVGVFPSNFVEEIQSSAPATKEENGKDEEEVAHKPEPVQIKEESKPKPIKIMCEVKYSYEAQNADELTLKEGDILTLISKDGQDAGWWCGELDGKTGVFPDNFVVVIDKTETDKILERRPSQQQQQNSVKTHVATQRKSQEIKPVKVESAPTNIPPAVPNKKPSIPFKKSPSGSGGGLLSSLTGFMKKSADSLDGAASSKSVKISNDLEPSKDPTESYHAFDNIERNPVLQDPRATRVKGPGRRPPSVALKDGESMLNGNSDYGSLEDAALPVDDKEAEIKPRSLDCQKPPWFDEMKKMHTKRTSPSPVPQPERGNRLEASTTSVEDARSAEVSPIDMSKSMPPAMFAQPKVKSSENKAEVKLPKTPPNELERVEKVALRPKPVVNVRPQTIEAPSRPTAKTSPTIHKSPSTSPSPLGKPPIADRSSTEMMSVRHFNELSERLAALELAMQQQHDEMTTKFNAAIDDLKGRLQVETDMRMLLQAELEKLQAQL